MTRARRAALLLILGASACGGRGESEVGEAQAILAAARRSLGDHAAVSGVATLFSRAVVQGPDGEFETLVYSSRDGRARIEQSGGWVAGIDSSMGWQYSRSIRRVDSIGPEVRAVIRGHELHMIALAPETRYSDPLFLGQDEFGGHPALVVRFLDELAEPLLAYYGRSDTIPLGFKVTYLDPDVVVSLGGWEQRGELRLFTAAEFRQGAELYRYEYTEITINKVADSVFLPPTHGR